MLYPPGYLCRIARMQASDHLGHPTKFRETGEEIATSYPQPRLSPYNTLPARRGTSYSRRLCSYESYSRSAQSQYG
jgi:hypothetical protein